MGGTVSAGVDNNDLVDNLLAVDYIKAPNIERAFRAVDRGMYFTELARESAYKDLAWKSGNLHLSAPCIYCEVMENLSLSRGMSFLNLGSGTGYLSTMAGFILGSFGLNHGVEIHHDVVQYAQEKLEEFKRTAAAIDMSDFCEPKFVQGNCLQLDSSSIKYDRVYCGAACPQSYETYMKNLIKVGGVLVLPINDRLMRITRVSETAWETEPVLPVAFANLLEPSSSPVVILPHAEPLSLMDACRTSIRAILQAAIEQEHPDLKVRLRVKSKLRRLFRPMFGESESMTIIAAGLGMDRDDLAESESDNVSNWDEQSCSNAWCIDKQSSENASGSSSSSSSSSSASCQELPHRVRLQQHPLSDDSDDPSDSNSNSSLTSYYHVQRALFRAMTSFDIDRDPSNLPSLCSSQSTPVSAATSELPDNETPRVDDPLVDVVTAESRVLLDDSSSTSMDVDHSGRKKPESLTAKLKLKCTGGTSSKRGRNKRKEAEMDESDWPSQSSSSTRSSSQACGSNGGRKSNAQQCDGKQTHSRKKKSGAKREKVDSGIGEDINNWEITSSGDWDLNVASDSDSEDSHVVHKSDEKFTILHGRRQRNGNLSAKRDKKGSPSSQDCDRRQLQANTYVRYMRSKIQQLPLPLSVKSYINFHREL